MKEIEVKILEINSSEVQKRLTDLGAQKVFEGNVSWVVFDFSDGSLSKQEILLRLRTVEEKAELTLKKLINSKKAKISEETNIIVSSFESTKKFLEAIGLKQKSGYPLKKHRISYSLNNVHFELDTLPNLPTFLEIEAPSEEIIKDYATKLGFSINDIKPWGTRELFAHYKKSK